MCTPENLWITIVVVIVVLRRASIIEKLLLRRRRRRRHHVMVHFQKRPLSSFAIPACLHHVWKDLVVLT